MSNISFKTKLTELINGYSKENDSNTPDFILAGYIENCLSAFTEAVQQRETWYGRDARPLPDPHKCGVGMGAECCIFLTVGVDGFCCEQFTDLRDTLIFKSMTSKRNPKEPYPFCMKFESKARHETHPCN